METIEKNHGYLSHLIEKRYANEKLLELEVMNIVSSLDSVIDYLPEKLYNDISTEKCDFWFRTDESEYWVEIKTRPTNYRKPSHARVITRGVSSVLEDINRLRRYCDKEFKKFCIFAFYLLYGNSYSTFNQVHLSRISDTLGKEIKGPDIHLGVSDGFFDIYVVRV
ncbi:MAG: hypothetical protein ACFFDT_25935 [Candidatus Hodarchaeota archaeon]